MLEDSVAVSNPGAKALRVRLRGADADNKGDGALDVRKKATDTGAWIRFADDTVEVPARTRAEVPFTVTVPPGATPGDHPGAVVVSAGGRDAGVRVHLRVSGPTLSALTVEHVWVAEGAITYDVVNRGNTTLSPRIEVTADGVFGTVLDRSRELPVEVLPGRRVGLTEPWKGTPALDDVDVKVTVTAGGGAADSATASARFVPWGAVGGALAVLAGAACATYWYLRRRPAALPPRLLQLLRRPGNVRSAP
ncbi:COG1470 family protein [Streptomyces sp. WG-D5]